MKTGILYDQSQNKGLTMISKHISKFRDILWVDFIAIFAGHNVINEKYLCVLRVEHGEK
jgi:hypothetical protein